LTSLIEAVFVLLKEVFVDGFHIKGGVEFVNDFGDERFAHHKFVKGESQFSQALNGGAGERAKFIRKDTQFHLLGIPLTRPNESSLFAVFRDIAKQVFTVNRGEGAIDGAPFSEAGQLGVVPVHSEDRQPTQLSDGNEGQGTIDGSANGKGKRMPLRLPPSERLAKQGH
jgi:hypothetical protein